MYQYFFPLAFLLFVSACGNTESQVTDENQDAGEEIIHFGEVITPDEALSYSSLLSMLSEADEVQCKVRAQVAAVCQTKGCWMHVTGSGSEELMLVEFHDYGFFMPKDLSGRTVVMAGRAYRDVTSVAELRHYAEDEGLSAEEIALITEPEVQLKFMATGVVIVD